MTEKRFRMEIIGASLPFIVDTDSAKKQSDKITSYHTYETDKKNKCLELVELLNTLYDEKEQLKSELCEKDIQLDFLKAENKHMSELVNENKQLKQQLTDCKDNKI